MKLFKLSVLLTLGLSLSFLTFGTTLAGCTKPSEMGETSAHAAVTETEANVAPQGEQKSEQKSEPTQAEKSEAAVEQSVAEKPVAKAKPTPKPVDKPVASATTPPASAAEKSPPPPEISMEELVERLKNTEAIGVLTKLAIRSDVIDFQKSVETYRKKAALEANEGVLRSCFDGLLLKILTLLERDPLLSKDIHLARESIWRSFMEAKS